LSRQARVWLGVLLVFGASTTALDLGLLRFSALILDGRQIQQSTSAPLLDANHAESNQALSDAWAWIREHSKPTAIVEANPNRLIYQYGLYSDRRGLAMGAECGGFTGQWAACSALERSVAKLYKSPDGLSKEPLPEESGSADFNRLCASYPLDLLLVESSDPVWSAPHSWMETRRPVYSNAFAKVFACRQ
jgi:hypothetical protein